MSRKNREEYNAYMKEYALKRYHTRMNEAIQKLGGKCIRCHTTKELHFDHIDPKTKEFGVGSNWSVSKERFWAEVDKCQLLCASCHKIKTIENWEYPQNQVDHGNYWMYKKYGCRCDLCKKAFTKKNRFYKIKTQINKRIKNILK